MADPKPASIKEKVKCKICKKPVTYLRIHFIKMKDCKSKYTEAEHKDLEIESEKREQEWRKNYNLKRKQEYDPVLRKQMYQKT